MGKFISGAQIKEMLKESIFSNKVEDLYNKVKNDPATERAKSIDMQDNSVNIHFETEVGYDFNNLKEDDIVKRLKLYLNQTKKDFIKYEKFSDTGLRGVGAMFSKETPYVRINGSISLRKTVPVLRNDGNTPIRANYDNYIFEFTENSTKNLGISEKEFINKYGEESSNKISTYILLTMNDANRKKNENKNNMVTTLTGTQIKEMLKESELQYNPVLGPDVTKSNTKSNKESNKETLTKIEASLKNNIKGDSKPVKFNTGKGGFNNNKSNLDLEYSMEPSDEFKDRVKDGLEGSPKMGNNADKDDEATTNAGSKEFYKNSKASSKEKLDNEYTLKNSGLTSKYIETPKKPTAFEGVDVKKMKRLNFKNTNFLGENHMFSLIPEDYKKDGNQFIMKDKGQDEYLVEWKIDNYSNNGVIKGHENKVKLAEEFNRIKNLYSYSQKDQMGIATNMAKQSEDKYIKENLDKIREILG